MHINSLNDDVNKLLTENGADLVGFADLAGFADMPRGVAIAVTIEADVLRSIQDGPNREYLDEYNRLNRKLDKLAVICAEFLKSKGYHARAQVTTAVVRSGDYAVALPHKTVATRAALGWIGKCALLVTKEYGSGVRISSVVTDAPLTVAEPVTESNCGSCEECVKHCPAGALKGQSWIVGAKREELVDVGLCYETAQRLCRESFGEERTICGKCIVVCPHTKKYLKSAP